MYPKVGTLNAPSRCASRCPAKTSRGAPHSSGKRADQEPASAHLHPRAEKQRPAVVEARSRMARRPARLRRRHFHGQQCRRRVARRCVARRCYSRRERRRRLELDCRRPCAPIPARSRIQSNLAPPARAWFTGASAPLAVAPATICLPGFISIPLTPPTEIMLMWHDGSSWEHRAFWGANTITYGQNGSAGRIICGPLPPAADGSGSACRRTPSVSKHRGQRMGFAQVDGRATWDAAPVQRQP